MAKLMKNRTDNDIKNKWNSMVRTQRLNEVRYGYATEVDQPSPWSPIPRSHAAGIRRLQVHGPGNTETAATELAPYNTTASFREGQNQAGKARDAEIDQVARNLYNWEKVKL
jgi:hypothetical protein